MSDHRYETRDGKIWCKDCNKPVSIPTGWRFNLVFAAILTAGGFLVGWFVGGKTGGFIGGGLAFLVGLIPARRRVR